MQQSGDHGSAPSRGGPLLRFHPLRDVLSGVPVSLLVEHRSEYSETPRFGPAFAEPAASAGSASTWLADRIERAAHAEALSPVGLRPLFVPAPSGALFDENTPVAARAALARTNLLPQEICLEFTDAALHLAGDQAEALVASIRKRGFRVSIDMTRSHSCPLSHSLRLMLDSVRFLAGDLQYDAVSQKLDLAKDAGMCVIAEKPRWRDADWLSSRGVGYALAPIADA